MPALQRQQEVHDRLHPQADHRRRRGAGDSPRRKSEVAEDPAVVEHEHSASPPPHRRSSRPTSGRGRCKTPKPTAPTIMRRPARAQDLKKLNFVAVRLGVMAGQGEEPAARRDAAKSTNAEAQVRSTPPAKRPGRFAPVARAVVLGDERVRVRTHAQRQAQTSRTRRSTTRTRPPSPCRRPS